MVKPSGLFIHLCTVAGNGGQTVIRPLVDLDVFGNKLGPLGSVVFAPSASWIQLYTGTAGADAGKVQIDPLATPFGPAGAVLTDFTITATNPGTASVEALLFLLYMNAADLAL